MKSVRVNIGDGYDVQIGRGLLKTVGRTARSLDATKDAARVLIVADTNTAPLYAEEVSMAFRLAGYTTKLAVIRAGEASKKLSVIGDICSVAAEAEMDRGDFFCSVGGGVTGDIAGICASLYMRGVNYINIPTTVLSQNDSAIGGKTAVDLPQGKNLIGAFHQPSLVVCDADTLSTLPEREWRSGAAEIIKHACIASDKLLEELAKMELMQNIEDITFRSVSIKTKIVSKDEREQGQRRLLNFGHTMGHAIEKASGYSYEHGESVAIGMVMASTAGERAGLTQVGTTEKLEALLQRYDLPITTDIPLDVLALNAMGDKKAQGGQITLSLIKKLGDGFLHTIRTCELKDFFVPSKPSWLK